MYLKDFRSQVRQRFADDSTSMSYSDWIVKNTTLRKKPFSFEGYDFQRQIVDDMSRNMSVIKCSQVGLTEVQLRKFAAFLARNTGVKGIFTLPDDNMFKRVSQTRFKPMIDNDKVFDLGSDKPIRSIPLYQIGLSFGYFVGNKEGDATSIDSDLLFHDELDLSDPEMIALFQSRLQGSDWKITQNFSTPTFEGIGIDAGFRISDQHEYVCKCSKCGHHNIPEYNQNFVVIPGLSSDINDLIEIDDEMANKLDLENAYLACERCHTPLRLGDPTMRSWVSRFPGRRERGYRVTPFCTHRLSLQYVVEQQLLYKRKDAVRRFYNTVLGKAYDDSSARLSELEIRTVMLGATDAKVDDQMPVFIGIDVGLTCHITLFHMAQKYPIAFAWRQVLADNLYSEVEMLLKTYNVIGGGMDRNPYTPLANDIRDLSNNRIMPFEYATTASAAPVQIMKDELDNISHIRINRTTAIDAFVTAIRKRKIEFYGYNQYESLLVHHLRDMIRVERADETAIWQKTSGNDHFFHSGTLGNYAIRVASALDYRSDADPRQLALTSGVTVSIPYGDDLAMKTRRKGLMSLGTL